MTFANPEQGIVRHSYNQSSVTFIINIHILVYTSLMIISYTLSKTLNLSKQLQLLGVDNPIALLGSTGHLQESNSVVLGTFHCLN